MIVDESALVRSVIRHILEKEPRISVVGTATDQASALDTMRSN